MTTVASAGMGAALLAAISVATLRSIQATGSLVSYTGADGQQVTEPVTVAPGQLAPYLAEAGLRPGAVVAALLLLLPCAALALQAVRVGGVPLRRRAAALALAGATPTDLRRVRIARTTAAFGHGGLWAGPLYLLAWLLLGLALPAGWRLLPVPAGWLPLAWLGVAALLVLVGGGFAALDRSSTSTPLQRQEQAATPPGRVLLWGSGLAALAVLAVLLRPTALSADVPFAAVLMVLLILVAVWVGTLLARRAARDDGSGSLVGDLTAPAGPPAPPVRRRRGGATTEVLLAAAQRRGNPRAAGTVGAVLFLCGLCFGVVAALGGGLGGVQLTDGGPYAEAYSRSDLLFYGGGAAVVVAVAVLGALVALASLALSLSEHLLTTRRSVASIAALGTETSRLQRVQVRALATTAVPATSAGTLIAGLLYSLTRLLVLPVAGLLSLAATVVAAVAAGVLVLLTCQLLGRTLAGRVRAAASLDNLRVP